MSDHFTDHQPVVGQPVVFQYQLELARMAASRRGEQAGWPAVKIAAFEDWYATYCEEIGFETIATVLPEFEQLWEAMS
jgi:hypothetical protein